LFLLPATDEHSQIKPHTHHPSQPAQAGFVLSSPQIYLPGAPSIMCDAYFGNVHQSPGNIHTRGFKRGPTPNP
jgi:hypothetical protein